MPRRERLILVLTLVLCTSGVGFLFAQDKPAEEIADFVGPDGGDNSCNNCHANEYEAWLQTTHYATFATRHRTEEAKAIQTNMDVRSMKRGDVCTNCHYTQVASDTGSARAVAGVSCESCHGAGKQWNDIHNRVGGSGATMAWGDGKAESAADREKRLSAAAAKGMIHSAMVYDIARNCFGCHTVPNEKLVNVGQHKAGSDFDLAAWASGEVRHNYPSSSGAPASPTNREFSAEERRKLYVIGSLVDLEVSLRNLANVQEKGGAFHKAMVERVNRARAKVDAIQKAAPVAELGSALGKLPASVDESTAVTTAQADALGGAAKGLVGKVGDLAALDSLIPTDSKGTAHK